MAFEALKVDVGRQAAEGPNDGGDGRLVLLGLHGVEELLELKSVKLVLQTTLPVLPAITRQPEFRWFVVRDSCLERLFVCTNVVDHDELTLVRPAVSLQEDPRALVAQQQLRAAVRGRAVVGHLQLAPARLFVKKRSSEKSEVLVTVRVGGEELRRGELVTSPHTTLPRRHSAAVAVKVQSRLSQSSGPVEAAPVMVSVAPVTGGCEARRRDCARGRQCARGHVAHREVPGVGRVVDVTETDSPSKALALICMLYRSSVPADCCTSPGMDPPKAPKCSLATPPSGTKKSRRAVLQTPCEGVPRKVAGDAHVVVVGRADVHHQVGGRAQPVPAAEGVASPRRQRVGAHDVPEALRVMA